MSEHRKKRGWVGLTAWISSGTVLSSLGVYFGVYPLLQDAYHTWTVYQNLKIEVCELHRGQDFIYSKMYAQSFADGQDHCVSNGGE